MYTTSATVDVCASLLVHCTSAWPSTHHVLITTTPRVTVLSLLSVCCHSSQHIIHIEHRLLCGVFNSLILSTRLHLGDWLLFQKRNDLVLSTMGGPHQQFLIQLELTSYMKHYSSSQYKLYISYCKTIVQHIMAYGHAWVIIEFAQCL